MIQKIYQILKKIRENLNFDLDNKIIIIKNKKNITLPQLE